MLVKGAPGVYRSWSSIATLYAAVSSAKGAMWPSLCPCTVINPILLTNFHQQPEISQQSYCFFSTFVGCWWFWGQICQDHLPFARTEIDHGAWLTANTMDLAIICQLWTHRIAGIILDMGLANEKRRCNVTSSLIGWVRTLNLMISVTTLKLLSPREY